MVKIAITEDMIKGKNNKYGSKGQIGKDEIPFPLFDYDFVNDFRLTRNQREDAMLLQNNLNIIASEKMVHTNSEVIMGLISDGLLEEIDGFLGRIVSVSQDICQHVPSDMNVILPVALIMFGVECNDAIRLLVQDYCDGLLKLKRLFEDAMNVIYQGKRLRDFTVPEIEF